jgi:phosphoribosylformylglycinamidine cyclo-ligase
MDAVIKLENLRIHEIFKIIRDEGNIADKEMLRTFNLGVGLIIVCSPDTQSEITSHLQSNDCECFNIGHITNGTKKVRYEGLLNW